MTLLGPGYTPSVPWVPTRDEVIEQLVSIIRPRHGDTVYDVGCGDGRVAVAVAKRHPGARVRCIEIRDDLADKARANASENGVEVEVVKADFFKYGLGDADIVYMYLLTSVNQKLRPKLEKELKPGTVVVTLDFPMPEWVEAARIELPRSWQRTLYIYIIGYSDKVQSGDVDWEAVLRGLSRINIEAVPLPARQRLQSLLEEARRLAAAPQPPHGPSTRVVE